MSARSTYGIGATIGGSAITALIDVTPPNTEAIDPLDDSRHSDTDGFERWVPSGRKRRTDFSLKANDVASCPGIAAAVAAVGGAAVAVVITYPASGGVITENCLIQSVVPGANPLTGKREVTINCKPSPART